MPEVGIVVIGRNEGPRLVRCLASIGGGRQVVYVDSGSTDNSVAEARAAGATVVELDMSIPFTAARARNAGRRALGEFCPFIQFVDGDCEFRPGWIEAATAALRGDAQIGAVFGQLMEYAPEASVYNWLCSIEWHAPPGEARYFGGNVMLRAAALDQTGGYSDGMIAGEEPDLAMRMRGNGWKIRCLDKEMMFHDAAIYRFSQWWRRARRSGHAYADLARRHCREFGDYCRRVLGVLFWGAAIPVAGLSLLLGGVFSGMAGLMIVGLVVLSLPILQLVRLALRELRRRPWRQAWTIAGFLMLAKPAQALGVAQFWLARLRGRRATLIEYKGPPQ